MFRVKNAPTQWQQYLKNLVKKTGASPDPCRYDFAGSGAASEPETKTIIKFLQDNVEKEHIKTFFSLHSFSQLVMFPYGTDERADNYDDLYKIGKSAVEAIKRTTSQEYKSGRIRKTIYPSSGGSKYWAHKIAKIPIAFTFELRGPPNSTDLFILPADQIRDRGREILAAFVAMLDEAKSLGYYNSITNEL